MVPHNWIKDSVFVEKLQSHDDFDDHDDIADVPVTEGSETLKSFESDVNNSFDNSNLTEQTGIRYSQTFDEEIIDFNDTAFEGLPTIQEQTQAQEQEQEQEEVKSTDAELALTPPPDIKHKEPHKKLTGDKKLQNFKQEYIKLGGDDADILRTTIQKMLKLRLLN